jgi:hypothetical protein
LPVPSTAGWTRTGRTSTRTAGIDSGSFSSRAGEFLYVTIFAFPGTEAFIEIATSVVETLDLAVA